jgi:hypothetical protein
LARIPKPVNLNFYLDKPGWPTILENAKQQFRLHINTSGTPFPTIEHNRSVATACLTEAIAAFKRNVGVGPGFDEGMEAIQLT